MKYIFVEGDDDVNFIENLKKDRSINDIKIITYANKKKEKINGMIKTIKSMKDEYVFLADLDEKKVDIKIKEIEKNFKEIEKEKIFFSIQEIEAWYLSGITDEQIKKYKIKKRILLDTQNITKEKFENIFKNSKDTLLEIKLEILSKFDYEVAKKRNSSLKEFLIKCI